MTDLIQRLNQRSFEFLDQSIPLPGDRSTSALLDEAAAALEAAAEREGELRARVDYLRTSRDGHAAASHEQFQRATRAEAQVADRDKRIAELEAALRPLVEPAKNCDPEEWAEDRRRARQALSAIPTPGRE